MKSLFYVIIIITLIACSNEPKQLSKDEKQAHEQVVKDNAAMDSMEKAIKAQIEAVSDDSLANIEH
ncbi:MAG: hypothetical protein MUE96_04730 [Bacteroidia bacterium]|jgi:hypothetical protein|nr:hypothetical protein [Bacteroidia bacterium]